MRDDRKSKSARAATICAILLSASAGVSASPTPVQYLRCTYTDRIGKIHPGRGVLIYKISRGHVHKWSRDWGGLWNGNDCEHGGICIVNRARILVTRPSEGYAMRLDRGTGKYNLKIGTEYTAVETCALTSEPIVHPGQGPHGEYNL